jgi:hypothetical protein
MHQLSRSAAHTVRGARPLACLTHVCARPAAGPTPHRPHDTLTHRVRRRTTWVAITQVSRSVAPAPELTSHQRASVRTRAAVQQPGTMSGTAAPAAGADRAKAAIAGALVADAATMPLHWCAPRAAGLRASATAAALPEHASTIRRSRATVLASVQARLEAVPEASATHPHAGFTTRPRFRRCSRAPTGSAAPSFSNRPAARFTRCRVARCRPMALSWPPC